MKKLLKIYGIYSNNTYYDICIESYINGQKTQAKEQFNAMPKANRKEMINYMLHEYESIKDQFHFFFQLL